MEAVDWPSIVGWGALGAGGLGLCAWVVTCLREREWRAAGLSLGLGLIVSAPLVILLVTDLPLRAGLILAAVGLAVLVVLLLALPLGRGPRGCEQIGPRPRIDERDAVFHRFYRLEPDTQAYAVYYREHPELAEPDAKLRAMPDLGAPGSRYHHPLSSAYMDGLFEVSAHVGELADAALEGEAAPAPIGASPAEFSARLRGLARSLGADRVGCGPLDPADVYSNIGRGPGDWGAPIELTHPWALVIGVEMDWAMIRQAPRTAATTETARCYLQGGMIATAVSRVIRRWGYAARAHVDGNYRVMCVPVAERAGLGETGRHGLLIAPGCGPRLRLSVVTTDLPLAPDPPARLGVQAFCEICKKCATNCPSAAVDAGEKAEHAGVRKWQTDQERCYRQWRRYGTDCGLCIRTCPFAKPGGPVHDLVRWAVARNPLARRLALLADDALYGRNPRRRYPNPGWHAER